jgi:anti-sigma regulatory factor (Ser/Thr protein kinase)
VKPRSRPRSPTARSDAARNLRMRMVAGAEAVTRMRRAAREFALAAGGGEGLAGDVMLSVSEAVTNAAKHAYPGRGQGPVELRARRVEERLEITVRDQGGGFQPGPSEGLGAGVRIIGECADTLKIDQGPGGVVVRMTFVLR